MRSMLSPERLIFLLTVTAMPMAAQRAPVSATVTVQVPAVYRVEVVPGIVDARGLPTVRIVTNVRQSLWTTNGAPASEGSEGAPARTPTEGTTRREKIPPH